MLFFWIYMHMDTDKWLIYYSGGKQPDKCMSIYKITPYPKGQTHNPKPYYQTRQMHITYQTKVSFQNVN